MNKKLWYLTRLSLNKKIKSKWFVVANIIILIVLVGILNIDYIGIIYNYLLNLINGVYATDKYKDCYCSRIRKIETENIKKL